MNRRKISTSRRPWHRNPALLTTVAIAGITPVHAISLGEATVDSHIGQTFSARIPVELRSDETLGAACVSVINGGGAQLATLPQAALAVPEVTGPGSHLIRVTTSQPLYEPMYELQVQVRCAGTPLIVRQYVLMLDLPAGTVPKAAQTAMAPVNSSEGEPAAAPTRSAPPRGRSATVTRTALARGDRYRVAEGDTLLDIAGRVAGRGTTIWAMANEIAKANPEAFIGGNPDLIKLGSDIAIPESGTGAVQSAAKAPATIPEPTAAAEPGPSAPADTTPYQTATDSTVAASVAAPGAPTPAESVESVESPVAPVTAADPVFVDEEPPPAVESAAEATPEPVASEPRRSPEWLAALLGLLIGGAVSAVLLRDRLAGFWRGRLSTVATRPASPDAPKRGSAATPASERTVRERVLRSESTMVVVESPAEEANAILGRATDRTDETPVVGAHAPYAPTGHDSDLSRLFGVNDAAADTSEIEAIPADSALDLDLSAASADATIDQEFSWMSDETALTPTQEVSAVATREDDTLEQLDLQTLAHQASVDKQVSATLEEALNLLENDYEEELTASQVLDRAHVERLLNADAEDTLVRTGSDKPRRR
jgi:hypothetical protein